jgi:c-di-GMP-binding flagellar brake protein YcgR
VRTDDQQRDQRMREDGEEPRTRQAAQRRDYVRSHTAPLQIELTIDGGTRTGWLIDLSEGGLRCSLRGASAPRVGDTFMVTMLLDQRAPLDLDAELVQIERQKDVWLLGGRFLDIPAPAADRIRAYVFDRQRQERRRDAGLG